MSAFYSFELREWLTVVLFPVTLQALLPKASEKGHRFQQAWKKEYIMNTIRSEKEGYKGSDNTPSISYGRWLNYAGVLSLPAYSILFFSLEGVARERKNKAIQCL